MRRPSCSSLVLVAKVEEIHGLANIEQAVGVVREAELLPRMVKVCLDQEVRAQRRRPAGDRLSFCRISAPIQGPERYVTVAISRASFIPACGGTFP